MTILLKEIWPIEKPDDTLFSQSARSYRTAGEAQLEIFGCNSHMLDPVLALQFRLAIQTERGLVVKAIS